MFMLPAISTILIPIRKRKSKYISHTSVWVWRKSNGILAYSLSRNRKPKQPLRLSIKDPNPETEILISHSSLGVTKEIPTASSPRQVKTTNIRQPLNPNPKSNPETEIRPPCLNYPQVQEYGCHLLAQPPGPVLNLNPNPETEILLYKSCLCLGMTKKIHKPPRLNPTASSPR